MATDNAWPVITVIGAGRMGAVIAVELARRGASVQVFDRSEFTRQRAVAAMYAELEQACRDRLIVQEDVTVTKQRLSVCSTMERAIRNAALVVESVPEDLRIKQSLFQELDAICEPQTVLSTNSINLTAGLIGGDLKAHSMCGVRFLHPVLFIPPVEVSGSAQHEVEKAKAMLTQLGFEPFFFDDSAHLPSVATTGQARRRLHPDEINQIHTQKRREVQQQVLLTASDPYGEYEKLTGQPLAEANRHEPMSQPVLDQSLSNSSPSQAECMVCLSAPKQALVLPCGHSDLCMECAMQLRVNRCPNCRQYIEKILRASTGVLVREIQDG